MNLNFNLEYYKAFFYAAKLQSFSGAAKALYLTQPTISQTIRRLEEDLGSVLFYRTSHGMMLTPEGELLFTHVEKAFSLLEAGETKLARFSSLRNKDLFVGATETGLFHFLLPRLPSFQQLYPNVNVHIKGCHSRELMQMLKNGSIDVAIGVSPIEDDPALSISRLLDFQDVFIAGSGFLELCSRTLKPEELAGFPLVFSGTGSSSSVNILRWFKQQHINISPQFSVVTTAFVLPFVQQNLAIGCIPDLFANQWARDYKLHILKLTASPPKRHIFLAVNDAMLFNVASSDFIRLMKTETTKTVC